MSIRNTAAIFAFAIGIASASVSSHASTNFDPEALDQSVKKALAQFNTPGMSVAVVHQGKTIYAKGHGLASLQNQQAVDQNTYFRLASTSKAFTAASLAILVDQEKLSWDDKVIDHLPEFQLADPWVTRAFTITDLLTHRSGLAGGEGDIMIWPEPSGFSRAEVVHNLRYLTATREFRSEYGYSNVMYITAGEIVEKISGMPFTEFVQENLFKPLNMNCFAGDMPRSLLDNAATPYSYNAERGLFALPRNAIKGEALMSAAAGGMVCNAAGMSKWIQALLAPSNLPFSEKTLQQMWSPHTILGVSENEEEWDGMLFKSYGMGWRLANLGQYKVVSHTGTLSGFQAYVVLIPELELGAVVLNNGANYGARGAVMRTIVSQFVPQNQVPTIGNDWIDEYVDYQAEREAAYLARNIVDPVGDGIMRIDEKDLLGRYADSWFGEFEISLNDDKVLRFDSLKMPTLKGHLEAFSHHTYVVRWDNQEAQSPLFVHIDTDVRQQVLGFTFAPFVERVLKRHAYSSLYFSKQAPITEPQPE